MSTTLVLPDNLPSVHDALALCDLDFLCFLESVLVVLFIGLLW